MVELLIAAALVAGGDSIEYRGDEGDLEVRAPRVESPSIRVDGRLDEAVWAGAAVLSGFTQFEPAEGRPATEPTEVRVLYSADAIYFGIHARDSRPDEIRATLGERDQGVFSDDWVRILLDTFHDTRQGYLFYVNPLGIQADGLWIEGIEGRRGGSGAPVDFNPDFIWDSDARIVEDGWVAEIRIPYVSLRFREAPVQSWGLQVTREVKRTGHKQAWAPITRDVANQLSLNGTLVDLRGLEPRRLIELNPVATGKRTGELSEQGEFVRNGFEPSFGLNARYGLTRNLVLDATLNPDFSQVEADEGQVAVNERFALFFPEKRPFFLEGTEIFNTPQRLVYTRAVVDPSGGAKLTGKLGPFNLGYLAALDESPVTFDSAGAEALFNVVRIRSDIGSGSTLGGVYTDRTLLDGSAYNRVAGVDGRLVLGRYAVTGQVAGAWTGEEGADEFGPLLHAQVARSGRVLSWEVRLEDVHPDFRARSGFIRRVGDAQLRGNVQRTFYRPAGSFLEAWGPELEVESFFGHDDLWAFRRPGEAQVQLQVDMDFRGSNGVNLFLQSGYFAFDPADYEGYALAPPSGDAPPGPFLLPDPMTNLLGIGAFGRLQPYGWLSLNGRASYQEVPIHAEASRGIELSLGPRLTLRPLTGLSTELSYELSRIVRRDDGSLFSVARIPRLRVQYQFTRALFARGILQYDLQERAALRDPRTGRPLIVSEDLPGPEASAEGDMRYDLLLSYQPSPGTIVYAGWTRQLEGPNTYRYGDLVPQAEGLFVKVSYLWRI